MVAHGRIEFKESEEGGGAGAPGVLTERAREDGACSMRAGAVAPAPPPWSKKQIQFEGKGEKKTTGNVQVLLCSRTQTECVLN